MTDLSNSREFSDQRGDFDVRSVGPFQTYPVVVNGWTVPHLQARYTEAGVTVTLDERFDLDLPADLAASVISFVADAIALSLGWSCHPRSPDWEPIRWMTNEPPMRSLPWSRVHQLGANHEGP